MNEVIGDFERICILKTCLYYCIDMNYLTTDDLLGIKDIAENELEIIKLYPIDYENPLLTLKMWRNQVLDEYEKLKEKIEVNGVI